MSLRSLASASLVATVIAAAPISLAAQAPKPAARAAAKTYTAPRTPWGDPDLQGNYTNVYENGTPLERPDQFAGRTLDEVRGAELTAIKKATQDRTINNFQGPIHAPDHWWQDALFLEKGSQAWFVTEPTDGKIPPVTAEAQRRIDAGRTLRASSGRGPADSFDDRSLYDRCVTRGRPGSMMPAIYGNSYRIVQGQWFVAIHSEMTHECDRSRRSLARTSARTCTWTWATRGHWEGDTLVVETTNFHPRSVYRNANPTRCGWSNVSPASRPTSEMVVTGRPTTDAARRLRCR